VSQDRRNEAVESLGAMRAGSMRALVECGWDFTLFEDGDRLILSVPSGGVAIFEVNVALTDEEAATFRAQGIERPSAVDP
jgi:hypothetical protein